MHQSTGMFPRSFGMVDEALLIADGETLAIDGGNPFRVLAYFDAAASGSVKLTLSNSAEIIVTCPTGGGKVLLERGSTEMYGVTSVTRDDTSLTGTAQVSFF